MRIDILGTKYELVETDDHNKLREGSWGLVTHDDSKIYLRKSLGKQCKNLTLWHEVIHAIDYKLGLDFDEETTDRLGQAIAYVVNNNKL